MDKWWGCLFYEELQILRERNMNRTRLKSVTLVSIEKEWSHCAFWPEGKNLGTYSPLFKRSGWDFSVNPPPFIRLVGTFLNQPQPVVLEQYCCWWWSFRFQINPRILLFSHHAPKLQLIQHLHGASDGFSIYMFFLVNFDIYMAFPATSELIESQTMSTLWRLHVLRFYQEIAS